jgi:hypothetical protein
VLQVIVAVLAVLSLALIGVGLGWAGKAQPAAVRIRPPEREMAEKEMPGATQQTRPLEPIRDRIRSLSGK